MSTRIENKLNKPIVVYYYSVNKSREAVRIDGRKAVEVSDFVSISPLSNHYIENKWIKVVLDSDKKQEKSEPAVSIGSKMEQAAKDIELYMSEVK